MAPEPALPTRSMAQDVYGSGVQDILADNGYSNDEPPRLRRQASNSSLNNVTLKNILHSNDNGASEAEQPTKFASFANMSRQNSEKGINFTYSEERDREEMSSFVSKKQTNSNGVSKNGEKKTTFAALPNTTTWQQQSNQQNQVTEHHSTGKLFVIYLIEKFVSSFFFFCC